MHKRNFALATGECLNDASYGVITFDVKTDGDNLLLLLPEPEDLDAVIGTSKWMIRQATAELLDRGGALSDESDQGVVEIVGLAASVQESGAGTGCDGLDAKLSW